MSIWKTEFKPGAGCPPITLDVVNARRLRLGSGGTLIYRDGVLSMRGIPIAHDLCSFGFEVNGKKLSYLISEISLESPHIATLISNLRSRGTTFLLPSLGYTKEQLGYNTFLYNSLLLPKYSDNYETLHLMYRYFPTDEYRMLEEFLKTCSRFVNQYTLGSRGNSRGIDVFVMKPSKPLRETAELFLNGKYSEFPDDVKKTILKFHKASKQSSLYGILYKTEEYRKELANSLGSRISSRAELYSIPVLKEEILSA